MFNLVILVYLILFYIGTDYILKFVQYFIEQCDVMAQVCRMFAYMYSCLPIQTVLLYS